jgi:hypothetical protein
MNIVRLVAGATTALMVANTAATSLATTATCFRVVDIEAEQAIRYQTELMVISDTCGSDSYRDFTVNNRDAIVFYQNQMMERFRRAGARSPRASLDSYLTQLANESALVASRERTPIVCSRSEALLAEGKKLSNDQFRHHMATLAAENHKGYRRCTG